MYPTQCSMVSLKLSVTIRRRKLVMCLAMMNLLAH